MRKLLHLVLCCLIAIPIAAQGIGGKAGIGGKEGSGGGPTINPVMGTCWGVNQNAGSVSTVAVPVTPTGGTGHTLIAFGRSASNATITFADNSGSNSWSALSPLTTQASIGTWARDWHADNILGGSYTVTLTFGVATTFSAAFVCEISNLASASVVDAGATSASSTAAFTTDFVTGTFSTTVADIVLLLVTVNSTSPNFVPGLIGGLPSLKMNPVSNACGVGYLNFSTAQTNITAEMLSPQTIGWIGFTVGLKSQ